MSFVGSVIENSAKLNRNGVTQDNMVDLGTDLFFELSPAPVEGAVKRSKLDDFSKDIIKSEIRKVNKVSEFGVEKKNHEKRKYEDN